MYSFHCAIHALPMDAVRDNAIELRGRTLRPFVAGQAGLGTPLAVSFEEVGGVLARLPRLFFEPDGSFVWVGDGPPAWQVDGVLYDRDGRLLFVDLKGRCPQPRFDQLLAILGRPDTPLMFQLVREALFLDETDFRRWAERE